MTMQSTISRAMLFLLFITAVLCSFIIPSNCKNHRLESGCFKEKITITVEREGCEPSKTNVTVCRGVCPSHTLSLLESPFREQNCSCCKATRNGLVKVRKVNFNCGGKIVKKNVFLSNIKRCSCRPCSSTL